MQKYTLETLLLYLENKLSKEQAEEISLYLSQNKEDLDYVLNLSKIKVYTEAIRHKIFIEELENTIKSICEGAVTLLEEKTLLFRGLKKTQGFQYEFFGRKVVLLKTDHQWYLYLVGFDDLEYEVVNENFESVFHYSDELIDGIMLERGQSYYVYLNDNDQNYLEIAL